MRKAICLVIVDFFSFLDVGCCPCCCPHGMFVMNKSDHKVVICYGHVNNIIIFVIIVATLQHVSR